MFGSRLAKLSCHNESPGRIADFQICSMGYVQRNDPLFGGADLPRVRKGVESKARIIRIGQSGARQ